MQTPRFGLATTRQRTLTIGITAFAALVGALAGPPSIAAQATPAATPTPTPTPTPSQQEPDAPLTAKELDAIEAGATIEVTGTRISRDSNVASPIPVQSVGQEEIRQSGEINLAEVVKNVPALISSSTGENDATGANALNLRGMGEARTLTLVNGRRHVPGFEGSQSVDIGSIPAVLVERVEVLTGGASAIYGSDAVTGVVNFILKENYEGYHLDVRGGVSGELDAENFAFQFLGGRNFHDDRGNVVLSLDVTNDTALRYGDRSWAANNGIARGQANPALRFQAGELSHASTPNLFDFYSFSTTGRYPSGLLIPSEGDFVADYAAEFGSAPSLTAAERALFTRATDAPSRAILPQPSFSISSKSGVIAPGDFGLGRLDVDGNGRDDCLDSFVGYNSTLVGAASFGIAGGCWTVNDDGSIRPYRDGLVAGNFNAFGGDGIEDNFDENFLLPETDRFTVNVNGHYDLTSKTKAFGEVKYSRSGTRYGGPLNTFYDLLYGAPENPFLPHELRGLANETGGLYITRDPTDLGPNIDDTARHTVRFVGGLKGELADGFDYEVAANFGRFVRNTTDRNEVILDRFFAAIDVVTNPLTGSPACRSDLDPTTIPATTIFGIPAFDPGFYTFRPGDGRCKPANVWGGRKSISQEAVDFITTTTHERLTLDQTVLSASLVGSSKPVFTLPAGPIQFAVGAEYRKEKSENEIDPLNLGFVPDGSPYPAGTLVSDVSDNGSLGFNAEGQFFNSSGDYDAKDVFAEVTVPLLRDRTLAKELTVDGAVRYANYSTIGGATTWKVGGLWSPVTDFSLRTGLARAIRAPNINELFGPDAPTTFRPVDPCDRNEIANAPNPAVRAANCRAAGLPADFLDPLSARFLGVSGGNADLQEETANTVTVGAVFKPSFLDGLALSVDYWNVEISDAISSVSAQDIVDNCYDSTSFPNEFCTLFTRNTDASSAQFGGFNFLRQTDINFAAVEGAGIDVALDYKRLVGVNLFGVRLSASWQDNLDFFTDPANPTVVDPELGEMQRPELSTSLDLSFLRGPLRLGWRVAYQGEQALRGVEIETYKDVYGDAGIGNSSYAHHAFVSHRVSDRFELYGGVNNVLDREPYSTEEAWPVSARGRYFFFGLEVTR